MAKAKIHPAGVVWTKRQRARLFGSLYPQPIDPVGPDGDAAWHTLRGLYGEPALYPRPDDAHRPSERVLDEMRAEFRVAAAPARSTPAREHLRLGLLLSEGASATEYYRNSKAVLEALVPFWVGRWGLGFASLTVWTPGIGPGSITCGEQRRTYVPNDHTVDQKLGGMELWWLHLRRALLAASPAEYEATRSVWNEAGAGAYACAATFCRSPDDAHRLVTRELARKSVAYGSIVLLSAIADPKLALRFAQAQPLNYACGAEFHAFHLVDNLGPAAAPVLLALLERVSSGTDARRALAAAAALADPAFCRTTLPKLRGPAATSLSAALK